MASCGIGASTVNVSQLEFSRRRICNVQPKITTGSWIGRRQLQNARITMSRKPMKASSLCFCSPLEAGSTTKTTDNVEESKSSSSGLSSQLAPSSSEVELLVTEICNTSITEFELKVGGFELHVLRNLTEKTTPPPPPSLPAPPPVAVSEEAPKSNGSVSSTSLAVTEQDSPRVVRSFLDKATDEGLAILRSPMVGYFRRCRTIKGKKAPPSCKENQIVKESQVLCFIEQLGGELPVESDISGEVIRILRKDGEPVGYGDALIAILPSFPGIKKLH